MTRAAPIIAVVLAACTAPSDGPPYDLLLTGGAIVDGTGNPRYVGDVALNGDRIAAVGRVPPGDARRVIDVSGLVVAPGFIDMLGWSEVRLLADGRALSKVTQGITTEVTGEGISVGPHTDATFAEDSAYRASIGVTATWRDLDGYFAEFERRGSAINLATFVGATQVRKVVLGNADRAPSDAELARMTALVDTAMQQGAVGLSTSLVYAPAFYATTAELIALARAAAARGGIYATHLRDEGAAIDAALEEAFRIGVEAQIPVEIWHLKRAGRAHWGDMPRVLAKIDSARGAGLDIAANVYPYPASATSLDASIPQWAHAGGARALLARLQDPAERARIRRHLEHPPDGAESFLRGAGGAGGVLVASVLADSLKHLEGKTLAEIAAGWRRDPIDALFDLVIKDQSETGAIYFSMNEDDVRAAAAHWWVSFCTDFGAVAPDGPLSRSGVHPRVYGSFPRVLGRYVRQERLLALEQAIRKMTSLPAQRVRLTDRGLLRPGFAADIVVFDPRTIIDRATFEQPHQLADGVRYVIVNGTLVLDDAALTDARPGRGLRGPGWTGHGRRQRS